MSFNNQQYGTLLAVISEQILRSRYKAAKLVNRELLELYLSVGMRLSEKIAAEKWGTGILERLSEDLQKQVPGLRGFSYRNLRNMRQFAEAYYSVFYVVGESGEGQDRKRGSIWQMSSAKLNEEKYGTFFSLGFSHHILLLNRCADFPERLFYMERAALNHWTVEMLDWQIKAKLYH